LWPAASSPAAALEAWVTTALRPIACGFEHTLHVSGREGGAVVEGLVLRSWRELDFDREDAGDLRKDGAEKPRRAIEPRGQRPESV
jgi:hypothetical protein